MTTVFGKQALIGVQAQMTNMLFTLILISAIGLPIAGILIETAIMIFVKIPPLWKNAKEKMNFFASIQEPASRKVKYQNGQAILILFLVKTCIFRKSL